MRSAPSRAILALLALPFIAGCGGPTAHWYGTKGAISGTTLNITTTTKMHFVEVVTGQCSAKLQVKSDAGTVDHLIVSASWGDGSPVDGHSSDDLVLTPGNWDVNTEMSDFMGSPIDLNCWDSLTIDASPA